MWPPRGLGLDGPPQEGVTKMPQPDFSKDDPHSLREPRQYLANRLGSHLIDLVEQKKINVHVFAGTESSLGLFAQKREMELVRIPSLYEAWGIHKFYALSNDGKDPRVIINVPPIKEYAQHYAAMLKLAGDPYPIVYLNDKDRELYRQRMAEAVDLIWQKANTKIDTVVLGYGYQWLGTLSDPGSWDWNTRTTPIEYDSNLGVKGTLVSAEHPHLPRAKKNIMIIESDLTIWGEATSFIVEGVTKHRPKLVFFLGSAGAPALDANIYDVSIPREFLVGRDLVPLKNVMTNLGTAYGFPNLHANKAFNTYANGNASDYGKIDVHFTATHGHTNSPAEQTHRYTRMYVEQGVHSFDVEQSLVARAIAEWNQHHKDHQIKFGAANLITDRPAYQEEPASSTTTHFDLDQVDYSRKAKARKAIVRLSLMTLTQSYLANYAKKGDCLSLQVEAPKSIKFRMEK